MRRPPLSTRLLAALALAVALAPAAARSAEVRFTVLHTTDLHGALTGWDYALDRPAPRGLVKIASLVNGVRAEGRPVLLLDAGDAIFGGPLQSVARASAAATDPMVAAMNRIGYDAMAPGNHELDFGLAALERARAEARFPWLAANVVRDADGRPAFGTSLVRELNGARVGVVGLCTPAVPALLDSSWWRGLRFLPPVEVARREVERLRGEERCDVVVLLAHTGLERDPRTGAARPEETPDENWGARLAEVPGVDLVILGHSHEALPWARGGGALVTQAGAHGRHLGRVDVTLEHGADGRRAVRTRADLIAVADSVTDDPEIAALARPHHAAAQRALSASAGTLAGPLAAPHGRLADSGPWDLIHRVQMDAAGAEVSLAALFDPGLRVARGPITRRDVMRLYPYDNTLLAVELTGAELKEVLEHAARHFQTYTFEDGRPIEAPGRAGYQFDSAEGVTYELDLTREPGDRVVGLALGGEPLDPARRLRVAVNSYRASGGGGYPALPGAKRLWRSRETVPELIERWLAADSVRQLPAISNWRILPDYALEPERPMVDLLVRRGIAPREQVLRLGPREPAARGDLAYWLARAFEWRSERPSNAFADVPDSLEPWLDGLLERKVLGVAAANDAIRPFAPLSTGMALDWCERAARAARYSLKRETDQQSFRRSLLTGLGTARDTASSAGLSRIGALTLVANTRYPQIRVLETSDFHGAILPGARERRTDRAVGGSAVLAAWIGKLRAENPEGTVLLDGGDCFQGTMISNLQFGRPVVEQMNALRYTAFAVGNHEFDWTADTLERRVRQMEFAALAANMKLRRGGRLPKWVRADTAFTRRGVDVGVVGLSYRNTPSVTLAQYVAHLRFEDDSVAAARSVPRLRKAGADVVLGVGHVPAESDTARRALRGDLVRLARGVPGVDAWFGGHSHNQVVDEVNGVPVLIPGSHGQYVAICDLVVDGVTGKVVERRTRLQPTYADEVTPDPAMAARVERWNAGVAPLAAVELGRNVRTLTRNRNRESALGDFVADAMRAAAGADLALQNSGGLRADLKEGVITRGAIYEVMPFDNTLVTMELTGAEIRRVFEEGLRFGRIAQLSGVRIAFDPDRPAMDRVVKLTLANGAPLEDGRTYKVAVNNFMATGGDDYDTLAKGRNVVDTGILVRGVLEDHVTALTRRGQALDVKLDGRIERLGNTPPPRDDR